MSAQKSILSFFSKTPKDENARSSSGKATRGENDEKEENDHENLTPRTENRKTKAKMENCSENGKNQFTSTPKRKKPESKTQQSKKSKLSVSSSSNKRKRVQIEDDEEEMEDERSEIPTDNSTFNETTDTSFAGASFQNESEMMQDDQGENEETGDMLEEGEFEHTKLEFLKPENIKDLKGRRPDDEDYDPTTLLIPHSYLKDQKPILRKWWDLKSENFDSILLFKVGKFYEMYHMDAVTAVNSLNLAYMKGGVGMDKKHVIAHCGFPEFVSGKFSNQLVNLGYKVARIEQMETPEMMKERNASASSGKKEKIVQRDLCRIVTPGTKNFGNVDSADGENAPKFLLAICETPDEIKRRYGVCFVDCALGKVWMSEFDDDQQSSRFRTLLAQYPPAEVLFTKKMISAATENVLNGLYGCKMESISWKKEFMASTDTLKKITAKNYFTADGTSDEAAEEEAWPAVLLDVLMEGDVLGTTCKKECELSISALGAVIWYLEKCLIDDDIFSLKLFEKYEPPIDWEREDVVHQSNIIPSITNNTMILDAAALKNLDVIQSSSKTNSTEGTLLELLDTCSTAFGKRLLRHWLCNPSCRVDVINERQNAIGNLLENSEFASHAASVLKKVPDLERLLQKIHTMGSKKRLDHPDNKAILFEMERYNKRKVEQFLSTVDGLHKVLELSDEFKKIANMVDSSLLKRCLITTENGNGRFPDLRRHLNDIESKFDMERARKDVVIVMSEELAKVNQAIDDITAKFESYLQSQKKKLSCSSIKYAQSKVKNRYALEIPEEIASRIPSDYKFVGQVKGFRRFTTNRIDELLQDLEKVEDERGGVFQDSMRRVFESFSDKCDIWRIAVDCMATLDVLLTMARYAANSEHTMCVPKMVNVNGNEKPFIEIVNGYHPSASKIYTLGQFMPNDSSIGSNQGSPAASVMLLTGPNMGGKSTLMRQVASLVILAHMGSYVPAESCSMSIVDRVFTRLGACDRLSAGQSTFAVELTETNMILRHTSVHSLVVIDELGRGTATHDGAAIAYAVLKQLSESGSCPRTLFSTHYHSLVARLQNHPNIALGHMACKVENENDDDPSEETITFLYKLAPGACPKSYGFHAAKLAGISNEIVKRAHGVAREIEAYSKPELAQRLRKLTKECQSMNDDELVAKVGNILTISLE